MFKEVLKELFGRKEGVFTVGFLLLVAFHILAIKLNLGDPKISKGEVAFNGVMLGFYGVLTMWHSQATYARVRRRHEDRPVIHTVRRYGCDCNVS